MRIKEAPKRISCSHVRTMEYSSTPSPSGPGDVLAVGVLQNKVCRVLETSKGSEGVVADVYRSCLRTAGISPLNAARNDQKLPPRSGAQVPGSAYHRYLQLIQLHPCAHATHAHAAFPEVKEKGLTVYVIFKMPDEDVIRPCTDTVY